MKRILLCAIATLTLHFTVCYGQNGAPREIQKGVSNEKQTTNGMESRISIFEIPATNISRAVHFYETILDIKIVLMAIQEMEMGIFPYEGQMVTGVIIKGDGYRPSSDGVTIYLNGGPDLQVILNKVEKNGGKISVPKTPHADESGFFALFLDTEGNRIGLHSPN
ncbi:hypothetical protein FGF1_20640 [Flavobacteriaceae bacterium GF1]